jgi:FkbM family methyltransferase
MESELTKKTFYVDELMWHIDDYKSSKCEDKQISEYFNNASVDILDSIDFEWAIKKNCIEFIEFFFSHIREFDVVYELLHDNNSKKTFMWLLKARIAYAFCGNIYKRLYSYLPGMRDLSIDDSIPSYQNHFNINGYDIYSIEYVMNDIWIREQYKLEKICEPEKGDVVFSIGAFYGETAIWFSDIVGNNGKVYAVEASSENCKCAKINVLKNGIKNVEVLNLCLWDCVTQLDYSSVSGSVFDLNPTEKICTTTLDIYMEKYDMESVDFLKMDIEGAEENVINGGKNFIKKFKPKLAISVYHKPSDFVVLTKLLKSIVPEYKFYLSQKRPDFFESVLFAIV